MVVRKTETRAIRAEPDIVAVRQLARAWAVECKFSAVDQAKFVTAASELARNTLEYGGGGEARIDQVANGPRVGLRLVFEDHGPGIPDIARALTDGYTSGKGMGLGLGGSKRLVSEFDIVSEVGKGTRVTITRWN
jgi:serine/threonine-protein kinase RsbT